jgi:uncharacterized lipoprotein YmbA
MTRAAIVVLCLALAACAVPERRDANVFLIGVSATMQAPQGVKP